jgi:hypothetical protein
MLGLGLHLVQLAVRGGASHVVGPQILISNRTQDENTAIGTTIGTFTVVGGTGTYTFSKTADPSSAFTLTGAVLKNAIVFDYETSTSYSLTVNANNGAGSSINRTLTIGVNDIDEVPPVITVSTSQTVAENAAFSLTLTADKPVTWTKTGGADTALFTLTGATLSLPAKDFEDVHGPAYVVQVTATSTAFAVSTNATITVNVTDVAGPTMTSSATFSVAENSAFSTTLSASESATFAKTGGADTALFTLSGATLSLPAQDYEAPADADANNSYLVIVKATSVATGEVGAAQNITVNVTNVVETTNYLLLANGTNYLLLAGTGKLLIVGGALLGADLVDGSGNTLVDGSSNTLTAN